MNSDNKISYDSMTVFEIKPVLSPVDKLNFSLYIDKLISEYDNAYQVPCFFWKYNSDKNTLTINDVKYSVEGDTFNQLVILANWLFDKKYKLVGSYHAIIDGNIEYISSNGIDAVLSHCILMMNNIETRDKKKVLIDKNDQNLIEAINSSVSEYLDKNPQATTPVKYYNVPDKTVNINVNLEYEKSKQDNITIDIIREQNIVLNNLQTRITHLEKKQKTQYYINFFMMKIIPVMSLFTMAGFIYSQWNNQ